MDDDEGIELALLGYILSDSDLWQAEVRQGDTDETGEPPKKKRRWWVRPWIKEKDTNEANTMYKLQMEISQLRDENEFRGMMRMDETQYKFLVEKLRPELTKEYTQLRDPVSVEVKLSITLTYLAYGGTMGLISRMFRQGRSTIHEILDATCPAIHKVLKENYVTTPTTTAEWEEIVQGFEARWNYPNCLGALDGKHVRVTCPANSGSLYFNYKRTFSINLMALVDSNYYIQYFDLGSEGRVADGTIWLSCSLQQWLKSGTLNLPQPKCWPNGEEHGVKPYTIVGDDAFPLTTYLTKPYSSRDLTRTKRIFNYRLSRARRVSENAFGIMANRFRVLLTNIYRTPERVVEMCKAIVALHNYLRKEGGPQYLGQGHVDTEDVNHHVVEGGWRRNNNTLPSLQPTRERNATTEAKENRDELAAYFAEGGGRVPWQDGMIDS